MPNATDNANITQITANQPCTFNDQELFTLLDATDPAIWLMSAQFNTDTNPDHEMLDFLLIEDSPVPSPTTSAQQPQVILPVTQMIQMPSSSNIQLKILAVDQTSLKTTMKAKSKTPAPRTQRAVTNKERCAKHRQKKKIQKQEEADEHKMLIRRNQELKIHGAYLQSKVTKMKEEMRTRGWI